MKIIEIPDDLAAKIDAAGADLDAFVIQAVEEKLQHSADLNGMTFGDRFLSGWIPPGRYGFAKS